MTKSIADGGEKFFRVHLVRKVEDYLVSEIDVKATSPKAAEALVQTMIDNGDSNVFDGFRFSEPGDAETPKIDEVSEIDETEALVEDLTGIAPCEYPGLPACTRAATGDDSLCDQHADPGRFCEDCGADIVGNDPHAPACRIERERDYTPAALRDIPRGSYTGWGPSKMIGGGFEPYSSDFGRFSR